LHILLPFPLLLLNPRLKHFQTGGAHDHQRSSQASSGVQHHQQQHHQQQHHQQQHHQQQAQAQAQAKVLLQHAAQHQQQQQQLNTAGFTSIKPSSTGMHQHSQTIQKQYHFQNGTPATNAGVTTTNLPSMIKIAAAGGRILPSTEPSPQNSGNVREGGAMKESANSTAGDEPIGSNKKQQKRAANRRSAQLSRKRKKQFIEELKEENDDLRRKEQILRAIPDLIVVFDSSGKLGFVSESVGRFLDVSPDELEGTSFWLLICEESVRMLKAAFMDSLAAREANSDTALLGSGVWELRLKDKNSKYMFVTLNGVVHFKGDAPECVCCIRPLGEEHQQQKQHSQEQQQIQPSASNQQSKTNGLENGNDVERGNRANKNSNRAVSCSDGDASRTSDGSNGTQQSVLTSRHGGVSMSSAEQDEAANDAKKRNKKFRRSTDNQNSNNNNVECDGTNNSVRVSDGDSNDGIESD
jgi:PAS domain-containing protein